MLAEQEMHGGAYLHEKLIAVDPATAAKIHPNDFRRLLRALEVFHLTKKPMSEQKHKRSGIREHYTVRLFFLDRERQALYERINRRVDAMFREGLIEEVKKLSNKKLSKTASLALGVREVQSYLQGKSTLEEAKEALKINTRHYSKRQMTWFRHEKDVEWIKVEPNESAKHIAQRIIRDGSRQLF